MDEEPTKPPLSPVENHEHDEEEKSFDATFEHEISGTRHLLQKSQEVKFVTDSLQIPRSAARSDSSNDNSPS